MALPTAYYRGISPNQLANAQYTSDGSFAPPQLVSMYDPQALSRLTGAVAQRQQRFDVATQGVAQEAAKIGETETFDKDLLENRLRVFEDKVNNLVQGKYGGDYSAAANELSMLVAEERTNPFYAFNKQKVSQGKNYQEDQRRIGAGFLSAGNPFNVTYDQWLKGEADFSYTPIDRKDIVAMSAGLFKGFADVIMGDPTFKPAPGTGGQYLQQIRQRGFAKPGEVEAFLADQGPTGGGEIIKQIYATMPELAGVENQNAIFESIRSGAYAGIGRTEVDVVPNQEYMDPAQRAKLSGGMGGGHGIVTPAGSVAIPVTEGSNPEFMDAVAKLVAEQEGVKDINNYKDLLEAQGKREQRLLTDTIIKYLSIAYGGPMMMMSTELTGMSDQLFDEHISKVLGNQEVQNLDVNLRRKLKKVLAEIGPDLLPTYRLDLNAAIGNPQLFNHLKAVNTSLEDDILTNMHRFNVFGKAEVNEKGLQKLDNINIIDFRVTPSGLVLGIKGENKAGETKQARIITKDLSYIQSFVAGLSTYDPAILEDYKVFRYNMLGKPVEEEE